ncbi:ISAzo13 family transposase [Frankia sp. AiPa1]|uniref:ISAzo13 family transposase n=1 Tax=Frankia sp. AiPa1 TaxID=573492 RepID=UPI00202B6270|nr:ISAzo13 family transposase [Frankia sp. AiPa1]MCL9758854.1 ISAzo13 family transposase [Frankia sp. AiPa1]
MRARLEAQRPHLDERRWRIAMGVEADSWGHGGIAAVASATGAARNTIKRGLEEASGPSLRPTGRVRAPGGGRKKVEEADPEVVEALDGLVEPESRGDPMTPLRWTTKGTRKLAVELTGMGHPVSHTVVAYILKSMGYSLQGTRKRHEGRGHPDRDAQFRHIHAAAARFMAAGDPVISVDTKKKELVGSFQQGGREWHRKGEPVEVSAYDFPYLADGKAIPYGVYDVADNSAWVSVGVTSDTARFAVGTIEKWWYEMGREKYPDTKRLMITADCGGSNGNTVWLWKQELARLAAATGLEITVCHFPPATSKWNKIEHRLFSYISVNWRGRPLTTYETVVNLIANTTTTTGLVVRCALDPADYPTGIKLSKKEQEKIPVERDEFHGEWNYMITSRQPDIE